MNYVELARVVGRLEGELQAIKVTIGRTEQKIDALVKANTLARGGKKMLLKIGTICSALGAGMMGLAEFAVKHLG